MPEKIAFHLIEIAQKTIDDKPAIMLFGKTPDDKQICVIDDSVAPYFYIIPKNSNELDEKLKKLSIKKEGREIKIMRLEQVKKRFLGKEVSALKAITPFPADLLAIRNEIKNLDNIDGIYEYDIPYTTRYLLDKGLAPLAFLEAEGEFAREHLKIPALKADKLKQLGEDYITEFNGLAFDIETYAPEGKTILPEKNPIIMIAFYSKNFKKAITWKHFKTNLPEIEFVNSEAELVKRFKDVIEHLKPDLLTGYFSDSFDLPYIKTRAEKYKIKLDLGIDYSELKVRKAAITQSKITGIPHLDIFKFIQKVTGLELESYELNYVAKRFLGEEKIKVDLAELAETFDVRHKDLEKFCMYNLRDAELTYRLYEKFLPNIIEFVKITGLNLYDVNRIGFSQFVESYIIREAQKFNEIIPEKPHHDEVAKRRMQTFKGGYVYEPMPGRYDKIAVFDFKSLYPSIISSHNISSETLNCSCCKAKSQEVEGYWLCKNKKGFISEIIGELIKKRTYIKDIIKKQKTRNYVLEAREHSLKLLANSFYGYLGFFNARWYSLECSKATTALGRYYLNLAIDSAKNAKFNVIYSDTDSLFITLNSKTKSHALEFSKKLNKKFSGKMELEFEGFYKSALFVPAKATYAGAKKKYALLSDEDELIIRGFETVRRNYSEIAKEVQEKVLEILLKENAPEKALAYVKEIISEIRNFKVPLSKVVIYTRLQKDIKSYDVVTPSVAIAQRLKEQGFEVSAGSVVRYVVTKGLGRIRDKARLPEEIKENDYDDDYYVNNQILPSIEKIFEVYGYSKEDIVGTAGQKKLERFFGR